MYSENIGKLWNVFEKLRKKNFGMLILVSLVIQVLSKGIHFVNTKQLGDKPSSKTDNGVTNRDSIVFVFRIIKESALDRLWEMHKDDDLGKSIKNALRTAEKDEQLLNNMDLELLFLENDYKEKKKILKKGKVLEQKNYASLNCITFRLFYYRYCD